MQTEEQLLERSVERILRVMVGVSAGGSLLFLVVKGWTWGAGFALGAAVSWLNFRWLKKIVEALGGARPKARVAVILGLRYLFMGAGAYVIVRYSSISLQAALTGLFVAVAAVIIEIMFQLVYARN